MTLLPKQLLGKWGEQVAKWYLLKKGYHFLVANYHTHGGEIDLIFLNLQNQTTIFVEVKTQTPHKELTTENNFTRRKISNMLTAMDHYLIEHPEIQEYQIDLVAIVKKPQTCVIRHWQNISISDPNATN